MEWWLEMVIEKILVRKGVKLNSEEMKVLLDIINIDDLSDTGTEKVCRENIDKKIITALEILTDFGLGYFFHDRYCIGNYNRCNNVELNETE